MSSEEQSPWMCHVCDKFFTIGEPDACSVCYKTTCSIHLKRVPVETESGILILQPVCLYCEMAKMV
ncbi:MAG TPA: hypothetical protein VJ974_02505 [Geopsychrobacteraceae bacterium]|nr:hypothetical protein [Geopsychrobacteraceae bacterium]